MMQSYFTGTSTEGKDDSIQLELALHGNNIFSRTKKEVSTSVVCYIKWACDRSNTK